MNTQTTFSYCPDCEAFKVLPCTCDPKPTKAADPVANTAPPAPAANTAAPVANTAAPADASAANTASANTK